MVLLQTPGFQTWLANKAANYLEDKTGYAIQLERLQIRWVDEIALQNLRVYDLHDSLMLGVGTLRMDFNLWELLRASEIELEDVDVERAKVQLITHLEDSVLNINDFFERIATIGPQKAEDTTSTSTPFRIKRIRVNKLDFTLSDITKDTLSSEIDYNHLKVHNIFAELRNFYLSADTVEMRVAGLEGIEPGSGFRVNNLRTDFHFSNQQLALRNLFLSAGTSTLRDSLVFNYNTPSDLADFVDAVDIRAHLRNSRIYSEDLALFVPALKGYDQFYQLDGMVEGRISSLDLRDIKIGFGQATSLEGNVRIDGLPDMDRTFLIARLDRSDIRVSDLRPYLPADIMRQIRPLTRVRFSGEFLGLLDDFVANGLFRTNLGDVQTDINLKLSGEIPSYSGSLALNNFQVGTLADVSDLGRVTMKGSVNGRGFNLEEAEVNLNAVISKLEYNDYTYTNIVTDAELAERLFKGDLSINDPNLKFDSRAYLDLRDNRNLINIEARLDTAFFKELNFTEQDIFLSTRLDTDLRGLQIDSISGFGQFLDTYLVYEGRSLSLDSLEFQSIIRQTERSIRINSSFVDVDIFGQFLLTDIARDIPIFINELQLALENKEEDIERYYAQKAGTEMPYYRTDFTFDLKDVNPIIQLFEPYLYVEQNTLLDGNFTNGASTVLSMGMQPEKIRYGTSNLRNAFIDFSISKIAATNDVLASVYASADVLETGTADTLLTGLLVDFIWSDQKIDFSSRILQPSTQSLAEISGIIDLLEDRTEVLFLPSNLKALAQEWHFSEDNKIILQKDTISFINLALQSAGQEVKLAGRLSPDPRDKSILSFDRFQIENLNPFLPFGIFGTADGSLSLQDYYGDEILDIGLSIDRLSFEQFLVGNLSVVSDWKSLEKLLGLELIVRREDMDMKEIIRVDGYYETGESDSPLSLIATLDSASINILEPFMEGLFSDISGRAFGSIRITGSPSAPLLEGRGTITRGRMRFDYLNTYYDFQGGIVFTENEIGFRNLVLTDVNANRGTIRGGIFHDGFKDFLMDISGTMTNMQVMNTTIRDNDLFYGRAFATGTFNVLGPVNNLLVSARATTNAGTQLYIPISDGSTIQQSDFIHFVSFKDSVQLAENLAARDAEVSGLRLDLDFTITPDAYTEIIFDQKAGDIIRARGRGNLKMLIDTQGDFNMFGDIEITQGAYNFSLYGIINKEFIIQEGSRISWLGDPYEATLDIRALYRQNASLAPLVRNDALLNDPAVQRRYPTSVVLDLKGSMLSPEITFGINIEEYPQGNIELETLVSSFKFRLDNDEQELNRQVFSLIILRTFSPENSFDTGGGGGLGRSVSELLSGQLSHYISQIDENLEVNLDLAGLDEQALNTFQLRLSYTFMDGRLRVTRDGAVTNVSNEVNVASLAGDWTAEYLLTSDGAFRVKIFSRTNLNMAIAALNNTATTTGLALMYTTSFDTLDELFANLRRKSKANTARIEEEDEDTDTDDEE